MHTCCHRRLSRQVWCNAGAESIIKQVVDMRTAAQAEMVLDESSEGDVVISYLSDLVQQAESKQAEQQRIVQHQAFLNLPKMVNDDLDLAREEVSLHARGQASARPQCIAQHAALSRRSRRYHLLLLLVTSCPACIFVMLLCNLIEHG